MKQKMYKLSQIEERVNNINVKLGIDAFELPSYGFGDDRRARYLKVNKDGYSFFGYDPYEDMKNQHLIIKTLDIDELLFEIFKAATRTMASNYEMENRIPDQDTRIVLFKKHIEILLSLELKKEFINKLSDYYDYLLHLKKPPPVPETW